MPAPVWKSSFELGPVQIQNGQKFVDYIHDKLSMPRVNLKLMSPTHKLSNEQREFMILPISIDTKI